jgi:hypothetical protein
MGDGDVKNLEPGKIILLGLVLISGLIAIAGMYGLATSIVTNHLVSGLIYTVLVLIGVYAALGVYREFVILMLLSSTVPTLTQNSKKDLLSSLSKQDRIGSLVEILLRFLEKIL